MRNKVTLSEHLNQASRLAQLALAQSRQTLHLLSDPVSSFCEEWFIDDGQAFAKPEDVETWMRQLDESISKVGGLRGSLADGAAKSSARLLCPDGSEAAHAGWDTQYVRHATKILQRNDFTTALGACIAMTLWSKK